MSKRNKHQPKDASANSPASAPAVAASIARPHELCSPAVAFKIKIGLLIALAAFFGVRLYFLSRTMAPWDDAGAIDTIMNAPEHISPLVLMRSWSYAPGHFFLTDFFVNFAGDYTSALFWGRLPSLLVWVGALFAVFHAFRSLLGREYFALCAALTVWVAVAWRGLLESSQSYNYIWVLPVSAFLTWLFVSPRGFACMTEPSQLWRPALGGFAAGMTCWMTYQGLFVSAVGFLALGIVTVWNKRWPAIKGLIAAGLAFSCVFGLVYQYSLKHVTSRGGGFGGVPGNTLWEKITFLPGAWFKVIENDFTFVPPPYGSLLVAIGVLLIAAYGAYQIYPFPIQSLRSLKKLLVAAYSAYQIYWSERLNPVEKRLLIYLAVLVSFWSVPPYFGAFPLSATRHTFILQFPLMLAFGLMLKHLHLSWRVYAGAMVVIAATFMATAPVLERSIRNHFDAAKISDILTSNPNALLLGYPGGSSLDYNLFLTAHPDWRVRMADGTWQWDFYMGYIEGTQSQVKAWPQPGWNNSHLTPYIVPTNSVSVYLVGIQSPMIQRDLDICKKHGFKVVSVAETAATGSVEPWRFGLPKDSYIGNSFYLYKLERAQ